MKICNWYYVLCCINRRSHNYSCKIKVLLYKCKLYFSWGHEAVPRIITINKMVASINTELCALLHHILKFLNWFLSWNYNLNRINNKKYHHPLPACQVVWQLQPSMVLPSQVSPVGNDTILSQAAWMMAEANWYQWLEQQLLQYQLYATEQYPEIQ